MAVDEVDFTLARGEIRAIIGPNGAGKTTLVSMICGRIAPVAGASTSMARTSRDCPPGPGSRAASPTPSRSRASSQNLTCFDNVALSAQQQLLARRGWWPSGHGHLASDVSTVLDRVGLSGRASWPRHCPMAINDCWR